jgi:hypothetical protein
VGNRSGQAYAFLAMTAILPGRADELNARLGAWPTGAQSPLARVAGTHFARFIVLDDLVHQGEPQIRDPLASKYLMFVTSFDGDLGDYLSAILSSMPVEAEEVWGLCVGFPGVSDREAFTKYMEHNQIETSFFIAAYPDATVEDVLSALAVREQVARFAVANQLSDPQLLMERWRAGIGGAR